MTYPLPDIRRTFKDVGYILLGTMALPLQVFLSKPGTFGGRYFSILRFSLGILAFPVIAACYGVRWGITHQSPLSLSAADLWTVRGVWLAYVIMGIIHLYKQYQRTVRGETQHTLSSGVGYLDKLKTIPPVKVHGVILRFTDETIRQVVEPGMIVLLSWLCLPVSMTRFSLLWLATALFIQNALIWRTYHQKARAMMDAHSVIEESVPTETFSPADGRERAAANVDNA